MDIEDKNNNNNNNKNSNTELDDFLHGNIVLKHSLVLVG